MAPNPLIDLVRHFAVLSLLAIGGANAVVPEMHRHAVEVAHWMTDQEFAALYAIGQAAPGPNVLVVTLIGWHVAGIAGALVATIAMCGPSSLLTYTVVRFWDRFKERPWRAYVQTGLAPVTVGLVAASAFLLARATDTGPVPVAVTLATSEGKLRDASGKLIAHGTETCLIFEAEKKGR